MDIWEKKTLHPEEKERERKIELYTKFYSVDIKRGDIVRYKDNYYALVIEVRSSSPVDWGKGMESQKRSGKLIWSTKSPFDEPEPEWHQFNSRDWSVMNR